MSVEKDLKKDGITVVKALDTLSINLVAKFVVDKLMSSFPFYGFNYEKLFIKVLRTPMYIAKIPSSMGEASYFYKNSSIYFKEGLSLDEMKHLAVHEFIHAYQEVKDKNNILYKLGLCDFSGFKVKGMALNEGAVQLMATKALKCENENVKYYDIEFNTNTPNFYPIICSLVKQMGYITGEDVLFSSTLNSDSKFINSFSKLCGQKTYQKIRDNLDKILHLEEEIAMTTYYLEQDELNQKFIAKSALKIGQYKNTIRNTFFETQELIVTSYFNNAVNNLHSTQEIEDFRRKLYNFKDLIGVKEDYSFFNEYYINMMTNLDEKYEALNDIELAIVPYKRSILQILIDKIFAYFGIIRTEKAINEQNN